MEDYTAHKGTADRQITGCMVHIEIMMVREGINWEAERRELLGQNLRNNGQPVAWMLLPAPS